MSEHKPVKKVLVGWFNWEGDGLIFTDEWKDAEGNRPSDPFGAVLATGGFLDWKVRVTIEAIEQKGDEKP